METTLIQSTETLLRAQDNKNVETLEFHPVTSDDIETIANYFALYPSKSDDFTVGGVMMWVELFDYEISEAYDSLFIKGKNPASGVAIFYAPVGPLSEDEYVDIINDYCDTHDLERMIILPSEVLPSAEGDGRPAGTPFEESMTEYLYDIEKFVTFSGKKMEKKRNHLNFFKRNYSPVVVEDISAANAADLIAFTLEFNAKNSENELADYECRQVMDALAHFDDFPYEGVALRYEGRIIGYSFGEKSGDTFIIHAEKANIEYRGVYQAVASELAKMVMGKYPDVKYLNREDDMGSEDLRKSKLSYHPALYIAKKVI